MFLKALINMFYQMFFNQTLFACSFNAITQICHCEIDKLHKDLEKKDDEGRDKEIQLCIQKSSLLERMFKSDSNKLFQMSKDSYS